MDDLASFLDSLLRAGFTLRGREGKLVVSPADALTPDLTEQIRAHRDALLRVVRGHPPPGRRAFYQDERAKILDGPEGAYLWTWERAPRWFYLAKREL